MNGKSPRQQLSVHVHQPDHQEPWCQVTVRDHKNRMMSLSDTCDQEWMTTQQLNQLVQQIVHDPAMFKQDCHKRRHSRVYKYM